MVRSIAFTESSERVANFVPPGQGTVTQTPFDRPPIGRPSTSEPMPRRVWAGLPPPRCTRASAFRIRDSRASQRDPGFSISRHRVAPSQFAGCGAKVVRTRFASRKPKLAISVGSPQVRSCQVGLKLGCFPFASVRALGASHRLEDCAPASHALPAIYRWAQGHRVRAESSLDWGVLAENG